MNKVYRDAVEKIKVDGENFAESAMKSVYLDQKQVLNKVHEFVGKMYIKYAKDGMLNLTPTQKASITIEVNTLLKEAGTELAQSEVNKAKDILSSVYEDSYYKSAYVMDIGMGGGK